MPYFQYDVLRKIAYFITQNTWMRNDALLIKEKTGLEFAAPSTHTPWRNYLRIFKLCLLMSEQNGTALPTPIAQILAQSGLVTCDEYIHFIIEATTDPSPALSEWQKKIVGGARVRYPLCFSLKYLLAKQIYLNKSITHINEVIGAYVESDFKGDEDNSMFLNIMSKGEAYADITTTSDSRQARESIKFISQISYLHNEGSNIIVSLNQKDAHEIFESLTPVDGIFEEDGNKEIQRVATFFKDGSKHDFFDYKNTVVSDVVESGFVEGAKVKKTHIVTERNSNLRKMFFAQRPTTICDACTIDTQKKYPWTERVLDLHHILPLSSGTRVSSRGAILDDLVPICPTCHRAIHRFYDTHLDVIGRKDFLDKKEAFEVYDGAKKSIIKENPHA